MLKANGMTGRNDTADQNVIVCRCEDVTLGEIRELIRKGYTTAVEIKLHSRCGMGSCQGRTCRRLVAGELARLTSERIEQIFPFTYRPPVIPVELQRLAAPEVERHG